MGRTYLRLVRGRNRDDQAETARFIEVQESLLPMTDRSLGICTADSLDEALLTTIVENLRPSLILDFRTTPRFDFGSFNRRKAFQLFELIGSQYRDLGNVAATLTAGTTPIADALTNALGEVELKANISSVLVFVDSGADFQNIGLTGVNTLRTQTTSAWELLLFGPTDIKGDTRNIIFISHANPEDNDFVLWLQTQLTRLGYETWSDLTELKAGEVFWDSIESVIRTRAVRVLAIVSRLAMKKPSVLDEISLAISVERSGQLNGFVIPIRIDDLPFSEFRANLARKNIVDFSGGWASGLSRLSDSLAKDRIPKARQDNQLSLASWWARRKPSVLSLVNTNEMLVSNRFRLTSSPLRVYSYSRDPQYANTALNSLVPFGDTWLSFLSPNELDRNGPSGLSKESVLSANEFFGGKVPIITGSTKRGNQQLFHRMLNNQWESFLVTRGFRLYRETGSRPTPYIPDGLLPKNTGYFRDEKGVARRRLVVGSSEKRKLFWHLAPLAFFSTHAETTLTIKMRVLFSEDGQDKWPTGDRIHVMRRSFCKNWWNDRWRSLQATLMAWLSEDHENIVLHSGDSGTIAIDSRPVCYISPVSIDEEYARTLEGSGGDDPSEVADDIESLYDLDLLGDEEGLSQQEDGM